MTYCGNPIPIGAQGRRFRLSPFLLASAKKKKASQFHGGCRDVMLQREVEIEGGVLFLLANPIHVAGSALAKDGLIGAQVSLPVEVVAVRSDQKVVPVDGLEVV